MACCRTGLWRDAEGKIWTLADSSIDTEIFELIGDPKFDEASRLWCQQLLSGSRMRLPEFSQFFRKN